MTGESFSTPDCNRPEKGTLKGNLSTIFQNEEWFGSENGMAMAVAQFVDVFSHISIGKKQEQCLHNLTDIFAVEINRGTLTINDLGSAMSVGALALPRYVSSLKIALLSSSQMNHCLVVCASESACILHPDSRELFVAAIQRVIPEHPSNVSLRDIFRF